MSAQAAPVDVADNRALAQCADEWRGCELVALDTEFVRETTFYPIPGLIQVGDDRRQYLLDPLTIDDWTPLRALFADTAVIKVLHSGGEDLELCNRLLGVAPAPLLDTQVGAALAGLGFSLGYQALVHTCLGIAVEKEHTRSNWVARPLSAAQRHYAALDVAYLPAVYRQLEQRLRELGRLAWWREEGERSVATSREQTDPEQYYLRLGAGWRPRGRDVPRGRLLKDAQCIELARALPQTTAALAAVPELLPQQVRREGETLLGLIDAARRAPPETWPAPIPAPLPREWGDDLRRLRQLGSERAAALDIPAELLVRKRDCEALLRTGILPEGLLGWRRAVVGDELAALARRLRGLPEPPAEL